MQKLKGRFAHKQKGEQKTWQMLRNFSTANFAYTKRIYTVENVFK